ncbi:MAG: MarR family transcriptional regulator [Chlorobi bacterium]|jgi:DNA-binding MarR family transcriptional regulator|nr:MarR family transcriptional regulator [Chlorobiota bacterium]
MKERISLLQRELNQPKPFVSPAQEGVVALLFTADLLRRRLIAIVEPHGITLQQYNVLRILRGADEGLPTMTIGERMIERTPGLTRLLDRLEAKGLVNRVRGGVDRRQVRCTISTAGLALLKKLDPVIDAANENLLGSLGDKERRKLVEMLEIIRSGIS